MRVIKYRLANAKLRPRRTKLEMPGWDGRKNPRADGSQEQVWHCRPFTEGAQYASRCSIRTTIHEKGRQGAAGRQLRPVP
jgi:hypothetical protein